MKIMEMTIKKKKSKFQGYTIVKFVLKRKKKRTLPHERGNVKRSASHADDGDHETQSMFSSIHCQLLKYVGLMLCVPILGVAIVDLHGRELMSLCAIYHKNQQCRVNQLTTQKSFYYLANQNKSLYIINVLVALGPAEWILNNIVYPLLYQRNWRCGHEQIFQVTKTDSLELKSGRIFYLQDCHSKKW
ncbi:hypothetical protein RFI_05018 [Reticulomyxa filosa]|uniref:Uncharacterized protein n=1 Tax=Reticulomyxa filosa TaxID=46433 RepID=X6P0L1_RETFI|nr:hypothetical protein RFI_05018 [Reticulomyxa filosa]|eukprot:ETO32100.1 hypothetical protein RFI_05018 [Reticulomyxa filosa]